MTRARERATPTRRDATCSPRSSSLVTPRALRVIAIVAMAASTLFVRPEPVEASDIHDPDFRVRLTAALVLGKDNPPGARRELEQALDDAHPAVRAAAAASLARIGDAGAVSALEARLRVESTESVRNQLRQAIQKLSVRPALVSASASAKSAKFMVEVGTVKNLTNVRGLDGVMRGSAREWAGKLGPLVEGAAPARAASQPPVIRLDGQLRSLAQGVEDGRRQVRAQVEFSVVRMPGKTLKGTLSGAATSRDTGGHSLASLQELAVRGAVESALANAGAGLSAAAE